ncbi:hypothetical protein TNCV_843261 [Trichonephila clavipes]|nr:hypothetical protein TNCV_843261 [Trichonephila clavipes]
MSPFEKECAIGFKEAGDQIAGSFNKWIQGMLPFDLGDENGQTMALLSVNKIVTRTSTNSESQAQFVTACIGKTSS